MLKSCLAGRLRLASVLFVTSIVPACGGGGGGGDAPAAGGSAAVPQSGSQAPPVPRSAPKAPSTFVDVTGVANINHEFGFQPRDSSLLSAQQIELYKNLSMATAGGTAAGDYDGDGDVDLVVARGDRGPNLLYRNEGGLTFADVGAQAGIAYTKSAGENYAHGAAVFADMDGDDDLDLFFGGLFGDPSVVFRNDGDGTFTDVTAGSGLDTLHARNTVSAAFGDYDLDGDLDLALAHWGTIRSPAAPGDTEHLWRNDSANGTIHFTSVSSEAGISPSIITLEDPHTSRNGVDYTFTPTFARLNDDLYPDLLMAADIGTSMVFVNDTDGTFTNVTDVEVIVDQYGMGSAVADYDDDGDLDWFVTSIFGFDSSAAEAAFGNRLYRNDGGASVFTDATNDAGVADGGWGWGACFIDIDNDGALDIYHTNGWPALSFWGSFTMDRSRLFLAKNGGFREMAHDVGLDDRQQGRGVVCADFDEDGDVDILLLHRAAGRSATLWRNEGGGNNYLRVDLHGVPPNTEAAGARVYARVGDEEQMREIMIGGSYTSQNPNTVIFGLGTASIVDELRVEWPDGSTETRVNVTSNQTLDIAQR